MITSLSLENFKSWRKLDKTRFAPITGFFGANSSGKSSILQFLLILKQTVELKDTAVTLFLGDRHSRVELGTYRDIIFRHDTSQSLRWHLGIDTGDYRIFEFRAECYLAQTIAMREMRYRFPKIEHSEAEIGNVYSEIGKPPQLIATGELDKSEEDLAPESLYPSPSFQSVKFSRFADGTPKSLLQVHYEQMGQSGLEDTLESLLYLTAVRATPQRETVWGGSNFSDVGAQGERTIDVILAANSQEGSPPFLEERVAYWLKTLGLLHSFRVSEVAPNTNLYRVYIKQSEEATEVLLSDVGFGLSQILPVLTLCFMAPEGSIVLLEHPEMHLHPTVQSGLADALIDAMQTRKIQIILESHSEHFLMRLQRRVAEEKITNEDVALYFCEAKEGESHCTELQITPYGEITNWPRDFFGDQFGELSKMQDAAIERKMAKVPVTV